jgi:lipopolysaccharide/colanic/teichoic acid biosynthesis glycosyltransferase
MQGTARVEVPPIDVVHGSAYRMVKRILDVSVAALLLIALSPVFLVCALLVWRSSPGPILFRQERIGEGGQPFTFLKFRSMRANSDPSLHQEYVAAFISGQAEQQPSGQRAMYKLTRDPRVTTAGHWLRKTSLDELPQLLNVLRGDMSMVGPRPPIRYELDHYRPEHFSRLAVKPGITGLWQVSGRSLTTFEEMVALDISYIQHPSIVEDLRILLKTVPVVFRQSGAQ